MKTKSPTAEKGKSDDGLQWHEKQGQYATDCGQYMSPKTNRPAWKRFYLGSEPTNAAKVKEYIRGEWKLLRLRGMKLWDETTLRRIAAMRAGVDLTVLDLTPPPTAATASPMSNSDSSNGGPVAAVVNGMTLYNLMVEYEKVLKQRFEAKQISGDHFYGFHLRINAAKRFIADMPLNQLGYSHLVGFAQQLAARPISKRGTPLGIATVHNYRQGLQELLTYAEDAGLWRPNCNWRRALKIKAASMLTADEVDHVRVVETFSPTALRQLWNCSTERERLYMLLALNCCMGGKEISTLKLKWVNLDVPTPYIERPRNKTRVPGRWALWPETVTLLRRHLAPNNGGANPNLYALLGFCGTPLVEVREKHRAVRNSSKITFAKRDEITHRFRKLRDKVKLRYKLAKIPLPFYSFRDTAYSWVKEHFGTEIAETFSQHKEKGMVTNYSNPLFEKVVKATNAMRAELITEVLKDRPNPIIHEHLGYDTSGQ
jgi:hypothetical protein